MNQTLLALEKHTGLGPVAASRLLGCAYPTYAQYRSGLRVLPKYHAYHLRVLLMLSPEDLAVVMQERLDGKS